MGLFGRSRDKGLEVGPSFWQRPPQVAILREAVNERNYGAVRDVHAHLAKYMPSEQMLSYLIGQAHSLRSAGDAETSGLLIQFVREVTSVHPFPALTTEEWAATEQ